MKRSILGILLGVALSAGGILIAGNRIGGPPKVDAVWPILVSVVVVVIVWLIQGAIMALMARTKLGELKLLSLTGVYLEAQAVAAVTPFGGGEVPYQVLELKRAGLPAALGGAIITLKSMMNGTILILGAVVGVLFFSGLPSVQDKYLLIAVGGIIFGWVLVILAMRWRRGPSDAGGQKSSSSGAGWKERISGFFGEMRGSLVEIWGQDRRAVLLSGLLMLLYWALYPLLGVLALLAAGWSGENWLVVFAVQFALYFVIPFAPTPGNSGAAEVAFVALMSGYVPHEALLGGVLIWRFFNHYSELVIGAFLAGPHISEDIRIAKEEFSSDDSG